MKFFHNKCFLPVQVKVENVFEVLADTYLSGNEQRVNKLFLSKRAGKTLSRPTTFYCTSCKTEVPIEELVGACEHCDESIPVSELFSSKSYPSILCEDGVTAVNQAVSTPFKFSPIVGILKTIKI